MDFSYTLEHILSLSDDIVAEGASQLPIKGISSLEDGREGDLCFLGNPKYRSQVSSCRGTYILLPMDFEGSPEPGQVYLRTADPSKILALFANLLEKDYSPEPEPGCHSSAIIDPTASIGEGSYIGPGCIVGEKARIGDGVYMQANVYVGRHAVVGNGSRLFANAVLQDHCVMGCQVVLQSGSVIGSDGFGFITEAGLHSKIPQIGNVVLEDGVEVGANTTIDRARFHETRIGKGAKIDNLVQIGHNVTIGKNALIVALVGIGGSTKLGDGVVLAGQAGVAGHLKIGDGVQIAAQAGVLHNLEPGTKVRGTPALPYNEFQRISALSRRLPEAFKRLKKLERQLPPPSPEEP